MDYQAKVLSYLQNAQNVFLTGGAGVGKTTLTKNIIAHYEAEAKKVAKLASTGMAATLIGGQTLHSFFDLGIADDMQALVKNKKEELKKKTKKLIASMSLIVIDEISMVSAELFEMIYFRLQQAQYKGSLLVVGDFLQLPPVVRVRAVNFAFESNAWVAFDFVSVTLTHIYRTDDKDFIELLHAVRYAQVDEKTHNALNAFIKPLPQDFGAYTFLFGRNDSASQHNKKQLASVEGELFVKKAQIVKHKKNLSQGSVERFMQDARIEPELVLKVGVPVLFTRNAWNYFNGERGMVVNIDASYVYVQKQDGMVIKLEQVAQQKTEWREKIVAGKKELAEEAICSIYQYPIKLAFAITIHKSQGMSIENLIIQTREIFAPSQFYVALSRASNPANLILIAPQRQWYELIYADKKAMEFVRSKQC
jgi:ATP-dependent exoDNAse (exonuclease V) alpha subunit